MVAARNRISEWKSGLPQADEATLSYMSLAGQTGFLSRYMAKSLTAKGAPGRHYQRSVFLHVV